MMVKLLSIIVPAYDMEGLLPRCLGSLVVSDAGLFQFLDVIVVNDGSRDRTSEIAHEFAAKYPEVFRALDKRNGNYGSCINAAIPLAYGRFVRILDADDAYDTAAFERYLKKLAEMPKDVDMVINDYVHEDVEGRVLKRIHYNLKDDQRYTPDEFISGQPDLAMQAVCYRTQLLRAMGYRQTEGISYTDTEWFFLPAGYSKVIRYIPSVVYRYLVGRAGQTMEHSVWIANRGMLECVAKRMLDQYAVVKPQSFGSKPYLASQIRRVFGLLLSVYTFDVPISQISAFFSWLRTVCAKNDVLGDMMRDITIFSSTPFRFRYVIFAMRFPALQRVCIGFVRKYHICVCKAR